MTTEEGVGVTEVVTTTTVLDLKVRRNENLICTYVYVRAYMQEGTVADENTQRT